MADPAIKLAIEVEHYLRKAGFYDKVIAFLRRRRAYPIIVVGPTGAGKTSLVQRLCGDTTLISRFNRTDAPLTHIMQSDDAYLRLIDTPGELHHETQRKTEILALIREGSAGVIVVNAFGFHEGKMHSSQAVAGNAPNEDFLTAGRRTEIDLLSEWVPLLCGPGGTCHWVASVVTKADLWWTPQDDQMVLKHYDQHDAPYRQGFGEGRIVPHSVFPYSAANSLFYGKVPMSGFYTDALRREHHQMLLAHLLQKAAEHG